MRSLGVLVPSLTKKEHFLKVTSCHYVVALMCQIFIKFLTSWESFGKCISVCDFDSPWSELVFKIT